MEIIGNLCTYRLAYETKLRTSKIIKEEKKQLRNGTIITFFFLEDGTVLDDRYERRYPLSNTAFANN